MSVTNSGGGGGGDQITVDTDAVHNAGKAICTDTQNFQDYLTTSRNHGWQAFHAHVTLPLLPTCLRNDFNDFYNKQKPAMDQLLENRGKIGQTLQQSASLWEFQDKVTAKSFAGPDIYTENNYFSPNETNPTNLQPPNP